MAIGQSDAIRLFNKAEKLANEREYEFSNQKYKGSMSIRVGKYIKDDLTRHRKTTRSREFEKSRVVVIP